jgi:hypothetical protein
MGIHTVYLIKLDRTAKSQKEGGNLRKHISGNCSFKNFAPALYKFRFFNSDIQNILRSLQKKNW